MLSKLDKAEKHPDRGWKGRLVDYSGDDENESSQSDSLEDDVLLKETGCKNKNLSTPKNKSPLDYTRQSSSYKIPKKRQWGTPPPKSNGLATNSPNNSSRNAQKLGFNSTFGTTSNHANHSRFHPSTKSMNQVRYRITRQWNNSPRIGRFPRPNLNTSRTRKREQPFESDIDMLSGNQSRNHGKPQSNKRQKDNDLADNIKDTGELKANDYFVGPIEKNTCTITSESEEDSLKQSQEESAESCLDDQSNSEHLNKDDAGVLSETGDLTWRHMPPSSDPYAFEGSDSSGPTIRHTFPSSKATPRNPIHKKSPEDNDNETKDSDSNKQSFYGKLLSNVYPYNTIKSSGIKTISGLKEDDKKRKLNGADIKSSQEPTKKRVSVRKNSQPKKRAPKPLPSPDMVEISSDEDDEKVPNTSTSNDSLNSKTSNKPDQVENTTKTKQKATSETPFDRDSFRAEIHLGSRIMLGSLPVKAQGALEISFDEIKWKIEHNDKDVTILIKPNEFTAVKIHVGEDPKIIVLDVAQCQAMRLINRFHGNGKFLDPGSLVSTEKYIILEVDDDLSQEMIADLAEWVLDKHGKPFEEMSLEDAQKLMACYASITQSTPKPRTYNTRSSSSRTTNSNVAPVKMLIYPPPPQHGGITVTSADVGCLAQGEFLNDVIIDFYLKYIYHDILDPRDRERTHIFSSYFYKRLTQKASYHTEGGVLSPEDRMHKMHDRVKKWTRNVDIFNKDFIVVPINESSHWFLAIICFPSLDGPIEEEEEVLSESNEVDESSQESLDVSNTDEEFQDAPSPSKKKSPKLPVIKANPCILIFDSLGGSGRARVYLNLRGYLKCEWKNKRPDNPEKNFNKETIKGTFPKVPHQDNHCDCGVFVLEYVESFFKDPIKNYRSPIDKKDWFTQQEIYSKRQQISDLITRLSQSDKEQPSSTEDNSSV